MPCYQNYREHVAGITCPDWEKTYKKSSSIDVNSDLNEKLNVDSKTYNTVLLTDLINHIHQPRTLMKEISRVLQKDGRLLFTAPFFYWINEASYDYHRYTKFELIKLYKKNNFKNF